MNAVNTLNKSEQQIFNNFDLQAGNTNFKGRNNKKNKFNWGVALSTAAGVLIPVLTIRKFQGKNLAKDVFQRKTLKQGAKAIWDSFKLEYGLKEILALNTGAVTGGFLGGLIFDKKGDKKSKVREGVFEFINSALPTCIMGASLGLMGKQNVIKSEKWQKALSSVLGVGVGMPLGCFISNKLSKHVIDKNEEHQRKLKFSDCLVHIDDLMGLALLGAPKLAEKIGADKILPIIYSLIGYEVGTADKGHHHGCK